MLEVRNLAFAYRHEQVLRDVSFVVSPGEVVCIVGANGTGKTTLMRILASLMVPDGGMILEDGINAFAQPLRYRRQIGYLGETPALYDDMTVKEYLNYRAMLKGEPAKRMRRRVNEAAEMCMVADRMRRRIGSLSTGLKKRVALADAILLRPRVLLLDDFLAGLDNDFRNAAGSILCNAAAFSSVIVTGHELSDFARWATRFLVLKNGIIASSITASGVEPSILCSRVGEAMHSAGGAK